MAHFYHYCRFDPARRSYFRLAAAVMLALAIRCPVARATNLFVAVSGTPAPPYTNWTTAHTSINDLVNYASAGDTLWVTNDVFMLTNYININKAIAIIGWNTNRDTTIINGNNFASKPVTNVFWSIMRALL